MKKRIYGYARVSTLQQNIDRQVKNIKEQFPDAVLVKEYYSGATFENRIQWQKLYNQVKKDLKNDYNVTIVFDEVTRLSRNAIEGFELYQELFDLGVNLIFLKDQHINSDVYRKALNIKIPMTNNSIDIILEAVQAYLLEVAKTQIKISFENSEQEIKYLHKRVSEGIRNAQLRGVKVGRTAGTKYPTKKSKRAKDVILQKSKSFGGFYSDSELIKILGISKNSFYKYKRELKH